jgi:riboflavin kinase/FMN adenylyltransferase
VDRGFEVVEVPAVELGGEVVSSSRIRGRIEAGEVADAGRMLGQPFSVTGEVVRGDGRGRGLGFPTANLRTDNELLPAHGVYVTETVVAASRYPSVTNVGRRPTFDAQDTTVESHLIEYEGDLYGESAEIRFLARIRGERKFSGAADLSDQIARDVAAAVAYFDNAI